MSRILDRYASAVHSRDLSVSDQTTYSDSDVLGAAGLAGKRHPLSIALARLFSGDNGAAGEIVSVLSGMAWGKARTSNVKLLRVESDDLARAVLAWHRDGTCTDCGGHGFGLIQGTLTIGDIECGACGGAGKIPFDRQFAQRIVGLARWLLAEIEREQAMAGAEAMQKLAPRLDVSG